MSLVRLASRLLRAVPRAGRGGPGAVSGVPCCSAQPTAPSGLASGPRKGLPLELEEMLVPRKMSVRPLESWLTAHCLLPSLAARAAGPAAPSLLCECPPGPVGEGAAQGVEVSDAAGVQCKNVLKIRRRKMNHHKYRKLVKRTRFLRRKVREGRLKRKQIKFERDLRRIWLKAGLKEAPAGWQTPKIYLKSQ
ncbi:aurora kinase A-interacting protein isoform X2 [Meles meles]|nr:aurora kinase A-interacting protein isoform X2 [Meles meles]XP_045879432.1 aurora kinase A-interacting protein isoform X2 [Meles meles]